MARPSRPRRAMPMRRLIPSRLPRVRTRPGWHRVGALVLLLVIIAATIGGLARVRIDTGMGSFLPAHDPALEAMEEKAEAFGGDPVIVLAESERPHELMLQQRKLARLLALEGRLAALPRVASVYGPATVLNQLAGSAQEMLAQISGRRDALRSTAIQLAKRAGASDREAAAAGAEAVARFDRRYGSLLVQGLPAGLPTLRNPSFVSAVLYGNDGRPRPDWQFVHPTTDTVAILVRPVEGLDQDAAARLTQAVRHEVARANLDLSKVTVTGVPAITSALADKARQELPTLAAIALVAVATVLMVAPWSRSRRSRLRPLAAAVTGAALTIAILGWVQPTLSLGVVAFLPILLGIGSDFPLYLSQAGSPRRPILAGLAAAAGFASLVLTPLPFVRELGLALALGVTITLAVALVLRRFAGVAEAEPDSVPGVIDKRQNGPRWLRIGSLLVGLGVATLGWGALPHLPIQSDPKELVRGLPELQDARYAERVLGSSGEVNVVLRGPNALSPAALRWADEVEDVAVDRYGQHLQAVMTLPRLLRFLGEDPSPSQIRAGVSLLPDYLTSAVVTPDRGTAVMTLGVDLRSVQRQRELLSHFRADLPPPPSGYQAEVVGLPVVAGRGLEAIAHGRYLGNLGGVLAAGLVLAIGLRRRTVALRAVTTVVFATGWVLALVWALGGALNPLNVAIGSLTTATGCEFAVMLSRTASSRERIMWRSVGTAAAAGTVGYLVLALSDLAVLQDFGLLLAASVTCSFLASILIAWAFDWRGGGQEDKPSTPTSQKPHDLNDREPTRILSATSHR